MSPFSLLALFFILPFSISSLRACRRARRRAAVPRHDAMSFSARFILRDYRTLYSAYKSFDSARVRHYVILSA